MNVRQALICTAFFCSTGTLHAQVCSGGAGGGTDATGNDCIDSTKTLREPTPTAGEPNDLRRPASNTISRLDRRLAGVQILSDNIEVVSSSTLVVGKSEAETSVRVTTAR
jgi:hypothetical protein